jgi:hypothetical protein
MSSRPSAFHTIALVCVIAMQGWLIYRVETALRAPQVASLPTRIVPMVPAKDGRQIAPPPLMATPTVDGGAEVSGRSPPPVQSGPKIDPNSPEAKAADRKLAELLPSGEVTQRVLADYQAKLEKLPAKEQAEVSAALSRAIEDGRVVYRHEP